MDAKNTAQQTEVNSTALSSQFESSNYEEDESEARTDESTACQDIQEEATELGEGVVIRRIEEL